MKEIKITINKSDELKLGIDRSKNLKLKLGESGSGGSYPPLANKPQINGVTLLGNKTSSEIKVQDAMDEITPQDIDVLIYG